MDVIETSDIGRNNMWNINSVWFELFIFSSILLFGNILMGHFIERTPRFKRIIKTVIILIIMLLISIFFGKIIAFIFFSLFLIPLLYVHIIILPKNGINGWTGEPKEKYYDFRKWNKDIFNKNKK